MNVGQHRSGVRRGQQQTTADPLNKPDHSPVADCNTRSTGDNTEGEDISLVQGLVIKGRSARGNEQMSDSSTSVDSTLPSTIYTSTQISTDLSLSSHDVASSMTSPRRSSSMTSPRRSIVLEQILSPFGGSTGKKKLHSAEKSIQERDQKIEELEAVLHSKTEIFEEMMSTIEQQTVEGEETGLISVQKIAELKEAFSLINAESSALSSSSEDGWSRSQSKVEDLEATISLQAEQNATLKSELTRLRTVIKGMETHEDTIEKLQTKIVKLEITSHLKDEEMKILKEELEMKVQCRDLTIDNMESTQIESLKAELLKIRANSKLREEEHQLELEKLSDMLGQCL